MFVNGFGSRAKFSACFMEQLLNSYKILTEKLFISRTMLYCLKTVTSVMIFCCPLEIISAQYIGL